MHLGSSFNPDMRESIVSKSTAPSSVRSQSLKYISILLAHPFLDARSVHKYLDGKDEAQPTHEEDLGREEQRISDVCSSLQKKILHTLHVRTKECSTSAYHDLFYFMAYVFSDLISRRVFVDFQFSVWDTKRSGPDYASDVALTTDITGFTVQDAPCVVALQQVCLN